MLARPVSAVTTVRPGLSIEELQEKARMARVAVLNMTYDAGSGHPGGSFSMIDFLTALYYNKMNITPETLDEADRDVFILSKGHCAPGLYAILGDLAFYDTKEFTRLRRLGGLLQGHADRKVPGIEMSTGSLGMGLGYGNGVAMAKRMDKIGGRVYVTLGDGELQEGNIWESAMTAAHYGLDNLCVLVDWNKIQIDGFVDDVKKVSPIDDKFRAFGFNVIVVDGHDIAACLDAFDQAEAHKGQPTCIIFDTEKGHGVSFMALKAEFHGRCLKDDEMVKAMAELGQVWDPQEVA